MILGEIVLVVKRRSRRSLPVRPTQHRHVVPMLRPVDGFRIRRKGSWDGTTGGILVLQVVAKGSANEVLAHGSSVIQVIQSHIPRPASRRAVLRRVHLKYLQQVESSGSYLMMKEASGGC
jgi:hypothetical protein